MSTFKHLFSIIAIFSLFLVSCEKNDDGPGPGYIAPGDSVYYFVSDLMAYWYLWNDKIPAEYDVLAYEDPNDLMESLTYKTFDKWSFIDIAKKVEASFEEGENFGYGFYLVRDQYAKIRIMMVYENTDAYVAGIRRGQQLTHINDISVDMMAQNDFDPFFSSDPGSMKFRLIDHEGTPMTITLTKSTYNQNAVMLSKVFNANGKTTGYLVYDSFLGYGRDEIMQALTSFQNQGVKNLILDLRYNGGGYVSIAQELAGIFAPAEKMNETFYTVKHNSDRSAEHDETVKILPRNISLDLDKLVIITSQFSASASELLINGLKPHMDIQVVGTPTYGKPVGMYGFKFDKWLAYPVTMKTVNALGEADYYDGIPADKDANDGVNLDWGDISEPCLSQSLHYISFGTWDETISLAPKSAFDQLPALQEKMEKRNYLILNQ